MTELLRRERSSKPSRQNNQHCICPALLRTSSKHADLHGGFLSLKNED